MSEPLYSCSDATAKSSNVINLHAVTSVALEVSFSDMSAQEIVARWTLPHRIHHLVSGENEQYAPAHMNFPLDQS
jgi:hypothetical protein